MPEDCQQTNHDTARMKPPLEYVRLEGTQDNQENWLHETQHFLVTYVLKATSLPFPLACQEEKDPFSSMAMLVNTGDFFSSNDCLFLAGILYVVCTLFLWVCLKRINGSSKGEIIYSTVVLTCFQKCILLRNSYLLEYVM